MESSKQLQEVKSNFKRKLAYNLYASICEQLHTGYLDNND
jgi:hypothetical protein